MEMECVEPIKPEPIYVYDLRAYNKLYESLLSANITKLKGRIRFSRSGRSAGIYRLEVTLVTNAYEHRLYFYEYDYQILAEWHVDGEPVALMTILNTHLYYEIVGTIRTLVKAGIINDDGEFDIELSDINVYV